MAIGQDYPPFNALDEKGRPWGWLVDIWKLWSQKTGIEVEFVAAPFGETLRLVGSGKVDVHGGCFYSEKRAEYLEYVAPLLKCSTSFFFHQGLYGIRDLADLQPYRIGIIKGDYAVGYLREKLPHASLVEFDTYQELFKALESGGLRVFVADVPVGLYYLKKRGLLADYTFRFDKPLYSSDFQAAVRKGATGLAEGVWQGLDKITPAERLAIERRWSGEAVRQGEDVLFVACERDNPPFSSVSMSGVRPTGILVDIWRLWAQKTGRQIEFVFGSRAETIEWVRKGRADIHCGLVREPAMISWLDFSLPFFAVNAGLFYRTQDGPISPEELTGQPVGVPKDSFLIGLLSKDYPGVKLEPAYSLKALARYLYQGKVRAAAAVAVSFQEAMRRMGSSGEITWSGKPLSVQSLQAGVTKDKYELLELVNEGLVSITHQEVLDIEKRWVPDETMRHFAHSGNKLELSAAEKKWLADRAEPLVAGAEMDWPPFDFVENGMPSGYSNELLRLAAQQADIQLEFLHGMSWAQLLERFRKGEIDILPAVYQTPERAREMAFTKDYAGNPAVLVVNSRHADINDLQDLAGRNLAVVEGFSTNRLIAEKHPEIKQVVVKNVLQGLKAVSLQKADAFVGGLGVITYILDENVIPHVRIANEVRLLKREATLLHMATLKSQAILTGILQKCLDAIPPKELQALKHRWLPVSTGSTQRAKAFTLTKEDREWLARHPKITLGVDPVWMPIEGITEEGDYQGISSGIVKLLGKKLGVSMSPEPGLSWAQVLAKARRGEVDLLPSAMRTPQREKFLLFTQPYISFPVVVATRDDAPAIVGLGDLRDRVIAVPEDYGVTELIRRDHPKLHIRPVRSIEQGLTLVDQGEVDAYVGNMASINYNMRRLGLKSLKVAATTKYHFELGMAVRKDWPLLAGLVQRALNSLTEHEKAAITSQWINTRFADRTDWGFIARAGGGAAAVVLLILAVIIFWNRRMAREVAQRKEAEARFRVITGNVPGVVYRRVLTPQGKLEYPYISQAIENVYGLTAQHAREHPEDLLALIHPDDRERFMASLAESAEDLSPWVLEFRVITTGGQLKWMRGSSMVHRDEAGNKVWDGLLLDVTDRKEAEERLEAMVANVPGTIFQLDIHADGRREYRYLSPRAVELFGAEPEEIIREKKLLPWHPEDRARVNQEIDQAMAARENVNLEARILAPGGEVKWVRLTASAVQMGKDKKGRLATGFILDVTKRKEAEERFKNMAGNVPGALFQFATDAQGGAHFTYLNQQAEEFFGVPPEVVIAEKRLLSFLPEDKERAIGEIEKALRHGRKLNLVARIFMPHGETAWIRISASPSQISDTEVVFNGFILNITERKMAEMEFLASERKVKAMSQAVEDALVMIDGQGKVLFWNPAAERLFGYSEEEALGMAFHDMAAPEEYLGEIGPGLERFARTGEGPVLGTTTEITARNRQGERFPVEVTLSSFQLEGEWYAVGTVRDITERKRAEEALVESQSRLDMAMSASNTGLWDWRPLDGQDFHNEQWFSQLGYTSQEFPPGSNPLMELMHPEDAVKFNQHVEVYLSGDDDAYKQEFRMKAKDGSWKWILSLGEVKERDQAGRAKRILGVHLDMTERKEAEQAIRDSERRMADIIDFLPDPTLVVDPEGRVMFWNRSMERITGVKKDQMVGKGDHEYSLPFYGERRPILVDLVSQWDEEMARQYLSITQEGDRLVSESFHEHLGDGGLYLSGIAAVLQDAHDRELGAIETLRDITERREAELKLAESEERSRLLLHSAGEGIFGVDAEGRVSFMNPAALSMLGWDEAEIMGRPVHTLIHHSRADGGEYPQDQCPMSITFTQGTAHQVDDEVLWRKDGTSFPVHYSSTPMLKDGEVMGAVITFQDITERKAAEEELRRNLDELERFSRLVVGREKKMIRLKEEINDLLHAAGQDKKYRIVDKEEVQ